MFFIDFCHAMGHTRAIFCALHVSDIRVLHASGETACELYFVCCMRVILRVLYASYTSCAACELYFVCCMRVILRVLHASHSSRVLHMSHCRVNSLIYRVATYLVRTGYKLRNG